MHVILNSEFVVFPDREIHVYSEDLGQLVLYYGRTAVLDIFSGKSFGAGAGFRKQLSKCFWYIECLPVLRAQYCLRMNQRLNCNGGGTNYI